MNVVNGYTSVALTHLHSRYCLRTSRVLRVPMKDYDHDLIQSKHQNKELQQQQSYACK